MVIEYEIFESINRLWNSTYYYRINQHIIMILVIFG